MKKNQKTEAEELEFKCKDCEKAFKSQHAVGEHWAHKHSTEKPAKKPRDKTQT